MAAEFLEHPAKSTERNQQLFFFDAETGKRKRTILYGDSSSIGGAANADAAAAHDPNAAESTAKINHDKSSTSAQAVTVKVSPINHLAFSADTKQIACLTASAELSYWLWGKNKLLAMNQLKGSWSGGVSVDPSIGTQIALSGPSGVWVGRYSEGKIFGAKVWEDEAVHLPISLDVVGHQLSIGPIAINWTPMATEQSSLGGNKVHLFIITNRCKRNCRSASRYRCLHTLFHRSKSIF